MLVLHLTVWCLVTLKRFSSRKKCSSYWSETSKKWTNPTWNNLIDSEKNLMVDLHGDLLKNIPSCSKYEMLPINNVDDYISWFNDLQLFDIYVCVSAICQTHSVSINEKLETNCFINLTNVRQSIKIYVSCRLVIIGFFKHAETVWEMYVRNDSKIGFPIKLFSWFYIKL